MSHLLQENINTVSFLDYINVRIVCWVDIGTIQIAS
jgi:hypothetical protein